MKKNKRILQFLFLSFLVFLAASYFTSNTASYVLTIVSSVMLFLYLFYELILNLKYNKKIYKIILSILKTILFILLVYLSIKKENTVNMDMLWTISRYIDKVGILFIITFLIDIIVDNKKGE